MKYIMTLRGENGKMNNLQIAFMVGIWILIIFVSSVAPVKLRRHYILGVPVSNKLYNKEITKIVRKYILINIAVGLIVATFTVILQLFWRSDFYVNIISIPVFVLINALLHINMSNKVLQNIKKDIAYSLETQVVIDTNFRQKLFTLRSSYLISFIMILLNILLVIWYYNDIPNTLPIHYNSAGNVDSYGEKRVGMVFVFNLIQLFLTILLIIVQEAVIRSRPELEVQAPEISSKLNQKNRYKLLKFINLITVLFVITFSLIQLSFLQIINSTISVITFFATSLLFLIGAITLSLQKITMENDIMKQVDDNKRINNFKEENWKGGLFYFNKNDPAIFVEMKSGNGFTINLGRYTGWFLLVLPFIFGLVIFLFAWFV